MTFTLPQEKVRGLIKLGQEVFQSKRVTLCKLTSLIGSLCSTVQAVLPAFLQVRYLQEQQIQALRVQMLLPNFSASEFKFCGIVEMVGKQPGIIKWRSNSTTFATTDYSKRG